jgi:hypothetical protein
MGVWGAEPQQNDTAADWMFEVGPRGPDGVSHALLAGLAEGASEHDLMIAYAAADMVALWRLCDLAETGRRVLARITTGVGVEDIWNPHDPEFVAATTNLSQRLTALTTKAA